MPKRKTPEEMALAARLKVARVIVRTKFSLEADAELNNLLADIEEDHNLELQTGGLKRIADGTLEGLIKDIADVGDVNRGVPERLSGNEVLPE